MLAQIDDKVLDMVQKTAVNAARSQIDRAVKMPDGPYLLIGPDGTARAQDAYKEPPEDRAYEANSISGVAEAMIALSDPGQGIRPAVLVSSSGVMGFFNELTRREAVRLVFEQSAAHNHVRSGFVDGEGRSHGPPELVYILRSDFAGLVGPETFLAQLRTMKFNKRNQSQTSTAANRESMGAEVEMECECPGGDVPETITLRYNVFDNTATSDDEKIARPLARVTCDTRLLLGQGRVSIKPRKSSVIEAENEAVRAVADYLLARFKAASKDIAVVCGVDPTKILF